MNRKRTLLVIDIFLMVLLVVADQVTKYLAVLKLKGKQPWIVLDGVFELHYLENRGAAFGMLQNQKLLFIFIAIVILTIIIYVLLKTPYQKKYVKLNLSLVFIASGAIGNLLDRVRFVYVVDFLYFSLINFPIFNVADIYVTLSAIYLVILLLFVYKEADLEYLTFRTKKFRDLK